MPTDPDKHDLLGFPGLEAEDPKRYIQKLFLVAEKYGLQYPKFFDGEVQELARHVNRVVNIFVKDENKRHAELDSGAFLEKDAVRILTFEGFGRRIWGGDSGARIRLQSSLSGPRPRWGVITDSGYESNDEDSIRLNLRYWMAARIQAAINAPCKEKKRKRTASHNSDGGRAATPPTSSGDQAPSMLSFPRCVDTEKVQASVAVLAPPPTEADQTPTATPTRSRDNEIGRRNEGEEIGQSVEGGLPMASPDPDNHTAQKPPPPARLHIPGLPNPVQLGQMTLVLTRDAEWNGQGTPTAHLTKRKVVAALKSWTPGKESRAIQEWAEDGTICLKDDEVLVLMCPGPSAFWYFPTRDFEVVYAAFIQEHQFNATQMCMKIMNDWRPKMQTCEEVHVTESGIIKSPLIDMGGEVHRLRLARSFFRDPVDAPALRASAGRLELARSVFLVPSYASGEEDGLLHAPWLPDTKVSEVTILVKAAQILNDCLVGILTLEDQERRVQLTWKTIELVQQLDHMIATYDQALHDHDAMTSTSTRSCKMYERVALRCPSELPPGQYLTRKSTGVVLILCSDKKAVRRHVLETGCILPGGVTDKPFVVVADDLGLGLDTIEEVDNKLIFHRSNSDSSVDCPVNDHPAVIISTMTVLTSWRWYHRLMNDACDATGILVSLLVLDGEDCQAGDLASFQSLVDRLSTPERVYEGHQNIDDSPVPMRFLFTFSGPADESPFSDRLSQLIQTQNRGSWKRQSIRDHGGPATPLSGAVARFCHQASAAPARTLGDGPAKLIKLLDTARIRVSSGLLRVQDDMWREWMLLASSTSLTKVDIEHSAEQLAVSNELFQICEGKKAELHSKGRSIDPTLRKPITRILVEQYAKCAMFGTFPSIAQIISDPLLAKWRFQGTSDAVKTLLSLRQDLDIWSWAPIILEGQGFRQSDLCGQIVNSVKGDPTAIWLKGLFPGTESHHDTFPVTLVIVRHILTRELTARMLMDMLPDVNVFVARIRGSWKTCSPEARSTDANKVIVLDTIVKSARVLITTPDTIPGDLNLSNIDRCVFLEQAAIAEVEIKTVHGILKNHATSNIAVLRPFTGATAELAACSREWRIEHSRFFDNLG